MQLCIDGKDCEKFILEARKKKSVLLDLQVRTNNYSTTEYGFEKETRW